MEVDAFCLCLLALSLDEEYLSSLATEVFAYNEMFNTINSHNQQSTAGYQHVNISIYLL